MEDIAHSTSGAEEAQVRFASFLITASNTVTQPILKAAKIRGLAQKAHAYKLKYKEVKTQGRELLEVMKEIALCQLQYVTNRVFLRFRSSPSWSNNWT